MRIIGDVHGKHEEYHRIIADVNTSVQVGDFGFNWSTLNPINPNCHKVLGGNHDNYDTAPNYPHYLGDFGIENVGGVQFFYVRGERSVDSHLRIEGRDWWRNEELSMEQCYDLIDAYSAAKPDIMISHGCPEEVLPFFVTNPNKFKPSRTTQILDALWNIHRPKLWFFGHHHISEKLVVGRCTFQCLNELEFVDI